MTGLTITKTHCFWGDWLQTLIGVVSVMIFAPIQVIASNGLVLKKLYRTCFSARRVLAAGNVILSQVYCALALPVPTPSNHTSTDIAAESYKLSHTSFNVVTAMGGIMIVIGLIQLAITVAKSWPRRQRCDDIPRNPPNCVAGAMAHAALRQPTDAGPSRATSHQVELSPISSNRTVPEGPGINDEPRQQVAPMPRTGLSRS